jgi:hypothetical protein
MSDGNEPTGSNSPHMPDGWENLPGSEEEIDPEDQFPIESEFRDGSERVRDDEGKYKSLSIAIIERYNNLNDLTPEIVAEQFEVSTETAREQLAHVRAVYSPKDTPTERQSKRSELDTDRIDESSEWTRY